MSAESQATAENEKGKPKRGTRKRQVHNEVERRRKGKINNWILRISELLPNEEGAKKSKIKILEEAVSYIKELVAERDKLLSDQCSEVQVQEIKSLKKTIRLLEEQNAAYVKLLQQAHISLASLPKKAQKYSNKFSEELGCALLNKFTSTCGEQRINGYNQSATSSTVSILPATVHSGSTGRMTVSTSVTASVVNTTASVAVSVTAPSSTTSQVPVSTAVPAVSGVMPASSTSVSVSHSVSRAGNGSLSNSGGVVTSALPAFPVMSSAVGSSFSNTYNKAMQIVILPAGTSFIQPSVVPSAISFVGTCVESMWPIIVPQNVPVPPLAVVSENAGNSVILQPELYVGGRTLVVPEQNTVPAVSAQPGNTTQSVSASLCSSVSTSALQCFVSRSDVPSKLSVSSCGPAATGSVHASSGKKKTASKTRKPKDTEKPQACSEMPSVTDSCSTVSKVAGIRHHQSPENRTDADTAVVQAASSQAQSLGRDYSESSSSSSGSPSSEDNSPGHSENSVTADLPSESHLGNPQDSERSTSSQSPVSDESQQLDTSSDALPTLSVSASNSSSRLMSSCCSLGPSTVSAGNSNKTPPSLQVLAANEVILLSSRLSVEPSVLISKQKLPKDNSFVLPVACKEKPVTANCSGVMELSQTCDHPVLSSSCANSGTRASASTVGTTAVSREMLLAKAFVVSSGSVTQITDSHFLSCGTSVACPIDHTSLLSVGDPKHPHVDSNLFVSGKSSTTPNNILMCPVNSIENSNQTVSEPFSANTTDTSHVTASTAVARGQISVTNSASLCIAPEGPSLNPQSGVPSSSQRNFLEVDSFNHSISSVIQADKVSFSGKLHSPQNSFLSFPALTCNNTVSGVKASFSSNAVISTTEPTYSRAVSQNKNSAASTVDSSTYSKTDATFNSGAPSVSSSTRVSVPGNSTCYDTTCTVNNCVASADDSSKTPASTSVTTVGGSCMDSTSSISRSISIFSSNPVVNEHRVCTSENSTCCTSFARGNSSTFESNGAADGISETYPCSTVSALADGRTGSTSVVSVTANHQSVTTVASIAGSQNVEVGISASSSASSTGSTKQHGVPGSTTAPHVGPLVGKQITDCSPTAQGTVSSELQCETSIQNTGSGNGSFASLYTGTNSAGCSSVVAGKTKNVRACENTLKSKPQKKVKPSPSTTTPPSLAAVTGDHFSAHALDVLNSALNAGDHVDETDMLQKGTSACSTSDILAKAAESIFGHDAFGSIELAADEHIHQQSDYSDQYDTAVAFTTSDMFPGALVMPSASKNTDMVGSKDTVSHNSAGGGTGLMTEGIQQASVNAYQNDSSTYSSVLDGLQSEVRNGYEDFVRQPPAKRAKVDSCETVSLGPCLDKNKRHGSNGSVEAGKTQTLVSGDGSGKRTEVDNRLNHAVSSSNSAETVNFSSISQCPLGNSGSVFSSSASLPHLPGGVQSQLSHVTTMKSTASSKGSSAQCASLSGVDNPSSCPSISHSVDNLFNSSYRNDMRNAATVPYTGISVSSGQCQSSSSVLYPGNVQNARKVCLPENCSSANGSASSVVHTAASKSLAHPTFQFPSYQTVGFCSGTSHHGGYGSTSVGATTASHSSNTFSSSVAQNLLLNAPSSSLLPCDLGNRNFQFYGNSFQNISTCASQVQRSYNVSLTNTEALSHSLTSLLKETPAVNSTGSSRSAVSSSNLAAASTVPSTASNCSTHSVSSNSKYSALSLISGNNFTPTTQAQIPQSASTSSSSCTRGSHGSSSSQMPKVALSYSAERLIHSQNGGHEKSKTKSGNPCFGSGKKHNGNGGNSSTVCTSQNLYKGNPYPPISGTNANGQSVSSLTLPPVTSFPSFPNNFPPSEVRVSANATGQTASDYQSSQQVHGKEGALAQNSGFNVMAQHVQKSTCITQASDQLAKSHGNLCLNVEAPGNLYSSCSFLQQNKPNLEIMKTSDACTSFQSIFVNSTYTQQKQNLCHFIDQSPMGNAEIVEKAFPIIPPIRSFYRDKSVTADQRPPPLPCNISQAGPAYVGNVFYEPNCSHEVSPGTKPSSTQSTQESYGASRSKQADGGQATNGPGPHKSMGGPAVKPKGKKSKHGSSADVVAKTNFSPNAANFSLFSVPDLSGGKPGVSHVPKTHAKSGNQPVISVSIDSVNQQAKLPDSMLGSVMHHTFNPTLHQQNDTLLNLNFQAPVYSENPLPVPPPPPALTLPSPCSSVSKSSRTFPTTTHPVPNFNLSNILPDMGSTINGGVGGGSSAIKFQPSSIAQGHQDLHTSNSGSILSVPHQSCAPSLYPPHPGVVPNPPLPPLLNHGHPSLNCSQPPMPVSGSTPTVPQPPHLNSKSANPSPFRNIIQALGFTN